MLRKPPFPEELYKNMERLKLNIVSRSEWGAKPALSEEVFPEYPVPNVVFGYTETEPCTTKESCIKTMQELQEQHMSQGQDDIRYSYVVGADGNIYEGRGKEKKAGHHYRFPDLKGNNIEVVHTGIRGALPDPERSAYAWQLLDELEWDGKIPQRPDYFLDYEDEYPEVDEEKIMADYGGNVLENLDID